jgi:hypothetical protein
MCVRVCVISISFGSVVVFILVPSCSRVLVPVSVLLLACLTLPALFQQHAAGR